MHAAAPAPARTALLAAALAVYLALASALISVGPGLGYDETIFHAGAVHMLTSAGPPPYTHSPHGWVHTGGWSWPLMMMPYAGAVSLYLVLPVLAAFGPSIVAVRLAAVLVAAFGMFGLGRLIAAVAGKAAAAAVVLALAVHPGFLSNTAFNGSGFGFWMAALGASCLALSRLVFRDRRGRPHTELIEVLP